MANEVTRRSFLSGTAGAISGAALLPNGNVQADISELEQVTHALHEVVGRHSERNAPFFTDPASARQIDNSLKFAMENLRDCSVDEIQDLLTPLYQGVAN